MYVLLSAIQDEEYIRKSEDCFNESLLVLNSDGWKEEKRIPETGDVVHSKLIKKNHKIFRITATVDIPPQILFDELSQNIENVPKWNPTLIECRLLKVWLSLLKCELICSL